MVALASPRHVSNTTTNSWNDYVPLTKIKAYLKEICYFNTYPMPTSLICIWNCYVNVNNKWPNWWVLLYQIWRLTRKESESTTYVLVARWRCPASHRTCRPRTACPAWCWPTTPPSRRCSSARSGTTTSSGRGRHSSSRYADHSRLGFCSVRDIMICYIQILWAPSARHLESFFGVEFCQLWILS